jgi:hypothetical protein
VLSSQQPGVTCTRDDKAARVGAGNRTGRAQLYIFLSCLWLHHSTCRPRYMYSTEGCPGTLLGLPLGARVC